MTGRARVDEIGGVGGGGKEAGYLVRRGVRVRGVRVEGAAANKNPVRAVKRGKAQAILYAGSIRVSNSTHSWLCGPPINNHVLATASVKQHRRGRAVNPASLSLLVCCLVPSRVCPRLRLDACCPGRLLPFTCSCVWTRASGKERLEKRASKGVVVLDAYKTCIPTAGQSTRHCSASLDQDAHDPFLLEPRLEVPDSRAELPNRGRVPPDGITVTLDRRPARQGGRQALTTSEYVNTREKTTGPVTGEQPDTAPPPWRPGDGPGLLQRLPGSPGETLPCRCRWASFCGFH